MATKFRLNSASVFTLGGNAIPCVTTITLDESADDYISQCMGNTSKSHILGLVNITGSFTGEIEDDEITEFAYIQVGDSGAMILKPAGNTTGQLNFTSTKMQITQRSPAFSSQALTTYSASFVLDDLTIAAIA
jgi:hypothetical protein